MCVMIHMIHMNKSQNTMIHLYVCYYDSSICVLWFIHMCVMIHMIHMNKSQNITSTWVIILYYSFNVCYEES